MPSKKVQEEKQHHKEAFELFYALSQEKRSIREVARQLKKAPSTVQSWAESFDWKERVEVRDGMVQKQFKELQQQNNDTLVEIKASFHKILKALIAEAIPRITSKTFRIEDIKELISIMKLDLQLLGEDDRQQQNQLNDLTEALKQSVQMFGGQSAQWVYDGNDRLPESGEENDDSGRD